MDDIYLRPFAILKFEKMEGNETDIGRRYDEKSKEEDADEGN